MGTSWKASAISKGCPMTNRESVTLQTVAFRINTTALHGNTVWTVRMPQSWKRALLNLETLRQDSRRQGQYDVTLPIRPLNAAIIAFCPELLTVPGGAVEDSQGRSREWLFAREELPLAPLSLIASSWCAETYDSTPACRPHIAKLNELFDSDLPTWERCEDVTGSKLAVNGLTAEPHPLAYDIIPAWVADLLVARDTRVRVMGHECQLMRVPSTQGAELMTWPPTEHITTDRAGRAVGRGKFSYTIHLTIQTLPEDPEPRLHAHYGVRRWVLNPLQAVKSTPDRPEGESILYLSSTNRSVYIRTERSWMTRGLAPAPMFTRASIYGRGERGARQAHWASNLDGIARRLHGPWVDLQRLLKAPEEYLHPGRNGLQAGIAVHHTPFYSVKTGLGFDDHEAITTTIAASLSDILTLEAPLSVQAAPLRKTKAHPLDRDILDMEPGERQQGLSATIATLAQAHNQVTPVLTVEVRWSTELYRDRIVAMIQHVLLDTTREGLWECALDAELLARTESVSEDDDAPENETISAVVQESLFGPPVVFETSLSSAQLREAPLPPSIWVPPTFADDELLIPLVGGGTVRVISRRADEHYAPLPEPTEPVKTPGQRVRYRKEAIQQRATALLGQLAPATGPAVAIIEMPNYQDPGRRQQRQLYGLRDPKPAVRLAYARAGYVTKFCDSTAPQDHREIRTERDMKRLRDTLYGHYRNTWLEALRQIGHLAAPPSFETTDPGLQMPKSLLIAGVWILRLTRKRAIQPVKIPLVVLMHSEYQQVNAWLPDGKGMRPFPQAMCDIACLEPERVKGGRRGQPDEKIEQLVTFLTHGIFDEAAGADVVVLVNAQNVRGSLTGMANSQIVPDHLKLLSTSQPLSVSAVRGKLRVIRVRHAVNRETPEWYVPGAKPGSGYNQGVWKLRDSKENRVFYNIARKASTMKQNAPTKQTDPESRIALPSILEIYAAVLQKGDNPELWAQAVDQWRRYEIGTIDMLLLPLPLHWASTADRYAEVIGPWVLSVPLADPGEDDASDGEEMDGGLLDEDSWQESFMIAPIQLPEDEYHSG